MGTLWKDHAFANLVTLVPTAKVNVRLLSNTKVSGISCHRCILGGGGKEQIKSFGFLQLCFTCINKITLLLIYFIVALTKRIITILEVVYPQSGSSSTIPGRIGIWKCWVLR